MGNNRQKKSSASSFFSLFKFKRNRRVEDHATMEEAPSSRRVWPSDEDRVRWVAEPGIDRRAEDFIARIHRNINTATDSERKTISIPSATAAANASKAYN